MQIKKRLLLLLIVLDKNFEYLLTLKCFEKVKINKKKTTKVLMKKIHTTTKQEK